MCIYRVAELDLLVKQQVSDGAAQVLLEVSYKDVLAKKDAKLVVLKVSSCVFMFANFYVLSSGLRLKMCVATQDVRKTLMGSDSAAKLQLNTMINQVDIGAPGMRLEVVHMNVIIGFYVCFATQPGWPLMPRGLRVPLRAVLVLRPVLWYARAALGVFLQQTLVLFECVVVVIQVCAPGFVGSTKECEGAPPASKRACQIKACPGKGCVG